MALLAERPGAAAALARTGALFAGLLAAGIAARMLGTRFLAHPEPTLGFALTLVAAGAVLAASGVPRQALAFAGGYAFGLWPGVALSLAAQMLGCLLDCWLARSLARDWAARRLRGRLASADRFLAARPFAATLTLRLLPVGNNLALNLIAGVSAMKLAPFLAATLLGYIPQTIVFALAGSGVHVNRFTQIGLGTGLFLASAGIGLALLKTSSLGTEISRAR